MLVCLLRCLSAAVSAAGSAAPANLRACGEALALAACPLLTLEPATLARFLLLHRSLLRLLQDRLVRLVLALELPNLRQTRSRHPHLLASVRLDLPELRSVLGRSVAACERGVQLGGLDLVEIQVLLGRRDGFHLPLSEAALPTFPVNRCRAALHPGLALVGVLLEGDAPSRP